jgi:hypothetical protein
MFCAEDRQRNSKAHRGEGCDLVDAASLGNIVPRGQEPNRAYYKTGAHIDKAVPVSPRITARIIGCIDLPNCYSFLEFYDKELRM